MSAKRSNKEITVRVLLIISALLGAWYASFLLYHGLRLLEKTMPAGYQQVAQWRQGLANIDARLESEPAQALADAQRLRDQLPLAASHLALAKALAKTGNAEGAKEAYLETLRTSDGGAAWNAAREALIKMDVPRQTIDEAIRKGNPPLKLPGPWGGNIWGWARLAAWVTRFLVLVWVALIVYTAHRTFEWPGSPETAAILSGVAWNLCFPQFAAKISLVTVSCYGWERFAMLTLICILLGNIFLQSMLESSESRGALVFWPIVIFAALKFWDVAPSEAVPFVSLATIMLLSYAYLKFQAGFLRPSPGPWLLAISVVLGTGATATAWMLIVPLMASMAGRALPPTYALF